MGQPANGSDRAQVRQMVGAHNLFHLFKGQTPAEAVGVVEPAGAKWWRLVGGEFRTTGLVNHGLQLEAEVPYG
jgi:hypothetical protein